MPKSRPNAIAESGLIKGSYFLLQTTQNTPALGASKSANIPETSHRASVPADFGRQTNA